MIITKAPRGTRDVLPEEAWKWVYLENQFRKICDQYGYGEIRTPTFEHTELFVRTVGETTDIVEKEMYTFKDKGNRSITLKPEGTAPTARAYIENKLYAQTQPIKLFYITPGFRYERPQAGRLREFHQFGVEVFGSKDPAVDAEVISLAMLFVKRLGIKDLELYINSIGCPVCRKAYRKKLLEYIKAVNDKLCNTCKIRVDKNPLRILDCKNETCQKALADAPEIIENLCDECKEHFDSLKKHLSLMGFDFKVNPRIVRGLDYYTKTVFEIMSHEVGSQNSVCGGGRYDGLVEECGGPPTPGIGFAMGIERLLMTIEAQNIELPKHTPFDVFIVTIGKEADDFGVEFLYKLREAGISADKDYLGRSIRSQMKYADKYNARYTVIIGDEEIKNGVLTIRNMKTGEQMEVKTDKAIDYLKNGGI